MPTPALLMALAMPASERSAEMSMSAVVPSPLVSETVLCDVASPVDAARVVETCDFASDTTSNVTEPVAWCSSWWWRP